MMTIYMTRWDRVKDTGSRMAAFIRKWAAKAAVGGVMGAVWLIMLWTLLPIIMIGFGLALGFMLAAFLVKATMEIIGEIVS